MKKTLSLALALILLLSLTPTAFATETGLSNFKKVNTYTDGMFSDVSLSSWYAENVQTAYELGLMVGNGSTFNPSGNLTIAEALTLACRLHNIYYGGTGSFEQGSPWYQVYVDYALANEIIAPGQYNYKAPATRLEFASILYAAFPAEALQPINNVSDGAIPDLDSSKPVYDLYRAGILTGSDDQGTFYPNSNIARSAVAAIVTRMAVTSLRKTISLYNPSAYEENFFKLANIIKSNGTYDELLGYSYSYARVSNITYSADYDEIGSTIKRITLSLSGGDTLESFCFYSEMKTPYYGQDIRPSNGVKMDDGTSILYFSADFDIDPLTYTKDTVIRINKTTYPQSMQSDVEAQFNVGLKLLLLVADTYLLSPNGLTCADLGFINYSISDSDSGSGSSTGGSPTTGEKNALTKAKSYLRIMAFSRSRLIEQLEYEGFSNSESVYAVDNCGADWYEQAVLKAASYLKIMAFSKQGLIEQLEYEGFTHSQAVYGVEQNGY